MKSLAQRVRGDERLALGDDVRVPAEGQIGFDPVLDQADPQLLQPRDLHLRERLVPEVGERRTAPEGERLAKMRRRPFGRVRRQRLPALPGEPLEPVHVELIGRDPEEVRTWPRQDNGFLRDRVERLAQP